MNKWSDAFQMVVMVENQVMLGTITLILDWLLELLTEKLLDVNHTLSQLAESPVKLNPSQLPQLAHHLALRDTPNLGMMTSISEIKVITLTLMFLISKLKS